MPAAAPASSRASSAGEKVGRYSFLATEPFFEIEAYGRRVTTNAHSGVSASGQPTLVTRQFDSENPLEELRRQVEAIRAVHLPELPPFCSGAVGYAGYDTVRYFERLPHAPPDDRCVPDMAFAFYDQMVVFDNVSKLITVVATARLDKPGVAARDAYDDACRRVDQLVERLALAFGRIASQGHRAARRRSSSITPRISPRPSTKRRCGSASSTSAPATSSRWSSASGWKRRWRPIPSRSIARCASSIPARSCSTSARRASRWWAARRR